jgi:hypothetical protein
MPDLGYSRSAVNELLRVAANCPLPSLHTYLFLSHSSDENRGHLNLLETGLPQVTSSLLDCYVDLVPQPPATRPYLARTTPQRHQIRHMRGAATLLSSTVGYGTCSELSTGIQAHNVDIDPVKDRLNSLEIARTILKLLNAVRLSPYIMSF